MEIISGRYEAKGRTVVQHRLSQRSSFAIAESQYCRWSVQSPDIVGIGLLFLQCDRSLATSQPFQRGVVSCGSLLTGGVNTPSE
jgi:hypothetical protein